MSDLRDQLQKTLGGSYSLERELGGGGMSRVFVAEETSLGRKVVVKVLPPDLAASVNVERFRREIQLAAKLQHPHIVPVLAAGVSEGLPYYTMPFIEGESLRARISSGGPLPVNEAVRILRDTLSALSYAHEHGIVHRDIKPDNILLTDQHAVVADFGVAKALSASTNPGSSLTSLGVALGTPAYMSPEQAAADPTTDSRADIYAVGAVAYEMLSGQQVFSARSPQTMLAAHALETPEPLQKRRPTVPPALAALIMRALEKYAADRPQTAREMLAQLDAAVTPSGASTTPYTGTMPARKVAASGRSTIMAIVAAVLLLGLGSSSWYWYKHKQPVVPGVGADSLGAASGAIGSVAVIPFVNTGGVAADEYFSDGMTDELAHALSRVPNLRVAGRTSSYAFKGKTIAPQQMGKQLNVAAIIEGSIRRSGDRLRIIAQLESAKDGSVIWSDSYESKAKDVFQLQDEFTKAIVSALTPALAGTKVTAIAQTNRGTTDEAAYELYLKGHFFFMRRGEAGLTKAIDYFKQALARDPNFARAHAGLSMALSVLPGYAAIVNTDSVTQLALDAAQKAVAVDPNLADAHLALANALTSRNPEAAEPEFLKALAMQPGDATTHQWHGDNLESLGRIAEALPEEIRAEQLDPLAAIIKNEVSYALYINDRLPEAVQLVRQGMEIDSTLSFLEQQLTLEYVFLRQPDSAVRVIERSFARDPHTPSARGTMVLAYAAAGRWADAARVREDIERPGNSQVVPLDKLYARLVFRDVPGALSVFNELTEHGTQQIIIGCDPIYSLLHHQPAFENRLAQVHVKVCANVAPWPIPPPPAKYAVKK